MSLEDPLPVPLPRLLEVGQVAHRMSVSQEYVRRLIRDGTLPAIRLGVMWRIDPVDLQAFIDRQRNGRSERRGLHLRRAGDAT